MMLAQQSLFAAPPPMAVESRRLCELPLRTTVPVCTGVCLPLI